MKLYVLYTERKPNLRELAARVFPSFTLSETVGCWKDQIEPGTKIEVYTDKENRVLALASLIKAVNSQEAVLVGYPNGKGVLV